MDCHRCENLRYDGCPYGRCVCPGHLNVRFSREDAKRRASEGNRPYNKQICPDFRMRKRCSNCKYWIRGSYFADGKTPSVKGRCSLKLSKDAAECPLWAKGKTSWKKRQDSSSH